MRLLSCTGTLTAALAASVAASPVLLANSAQAIDLKNFIPKQVFVKQANPTSVAVLSIQGTTNTPEGVMCDVTYTSGSVSQRNHLQGTLWQQPLPVVPG